MVSVQGLQELKNELYQFDKMNLKEMQQFASHFREVIDRYYNELSAASILFKSYVEYVFISHIQILDSFITMLHDIEESELKLLRKVLQYHFTAILDSLTYSCIALANKHN